MEINGYSEKATPYIVFPVGEVALSKDEPLSVDLTMFPEAPTATNTPEPDEEVVVSSVVVVVVPEVLLSQEVPSEEVRMVPESPTVTNNPVVVELSVFVVLDELLDEEQDMEMKLKRNTEKIMSICLTWFPIGGYRRTRNIPSIGLIYKNEGGLWWVSDCEEIEGVTHKREWGREIIESK